MLKKNFPVEPEEDGDKYMISYGAFKKLTVWIDNKKLCVATESEKDVSDEVVLDTNKCFRKFLEEATGYTAKERLKKAKKEVGD